MINLDKDKNYLLACSFGPDSMALFDMLIKEKIHFSAALVNYHIRPESSDEMTNFIHYCEKHKISYHVKDLVNGIGDHNLESECRKIRYKFFAQLVEQFHYDAVLIAHNQDDVLETYLMQKRRQNLVSFYGIKEITEIDGATIIRPLLKVSKQELMDYCHDNKVPFAIDSTNFDERYLRNDIRHNIVKKMVRGERDRMLKEIEEKNQTLMAMFSFLQSLNLNNVDNLMILGELEFAYALNILIKRVDESMYVSYKQSHEIRGILIRKSGNVDIPIRKGIVLRRSYDYVEFIKPGKVSYSYQIDKPCEFDCQYFHLDFTGDTSNRNVNRDDYPLTIRNYRRGDKYKIKNYYVSVRRLFIDWKMPTTLRQRWPIILNHKGTIIYIPRYKKDFVIKDNINFYVK